MGRDGKNSRDPIGHPSNGSKSSPWDGYLILTVCYEHTRDQGTLGSIATQL
jgi:hypothetical protein